MPHAGLRVVTRDLVAAPGKGKSVIVADDTLLDMGQDRSQLQLWRQNSMLIRKVRDRPRETLIPLRPVFGFQERVGGLYGGDFGQTQIFHQAVLGGEKA